MRDQTNPMLFFSRFPSTVTKAIAPVLGLMIGLGAGLYAHTVSAASADSAPPELKSTLAQIDAASSKRDIKTLMQFFSPKFSNTDGLNRQNMEKALTQFWQRYPKAEYKTQIQSWEKQDNAIIAETVTEINGVQLLDGRNVKLQSKLRSRQRFEGNKIVQQDILSERTHLTTGQKPPTVEIALPEQVRVGQQYNLDAVVTEPLGDNLLIGTAIEEPANPSTYLNPKPLKLEPLPAGGIFKLGKAPAKKGNYLVSTVLIRADGMTLITQRLKVQE